MTERILKAFEARSVIWDLTLKQLRGKYSGSRLGLWWSFITPLILAFSITFVFQTVYRINTANYVFFVLSGILPWFFFSAAITQSVSVFGTNLLKQTVFPCEYIAFSSVLSDFLNFLIGLAVILPVFLFFQKYFSVFLLLPFFLLNFFVFVLGISLLFSVIGVLNRDVACILPFALMILFWVTPVFYSHEMLPARLQWMVWINPLAYYIIPLREILFRGKMPLALIMSASCVISVLSFALGYYSLVVRETEILKRIR
jgi:lipopolysaccharide transport system permease protein